MPSGGSLWECDRIDIVEVHIRYVAVLYIRRNYLLTPWTRVLLEKLIGF